MAYDVSEMKIPREKLRLERSSSDWNMQQQRLQHGFPLRLESWRVSGPEKSWHPSQFPAVWPPSTQNGLIEPA